MKTIYHLTPAERWHTWSEGMPYLPAEYEADGFVHCTVGDELMLKVANRYYRDVPGDFVILVIDPALLTSPLKWEHASDELATEFPHIYGPIDREAIVGELVMQRAPDGRFVAII